MESVVMATFCTLVIFLFLQFVNFQAAIGPDSPMSLGKITAWIKEFKTK